MGLVGGDSVGRSRWSVMLVVSVLGMVVTAAANAQSPGAAGAPSSVPMASGPLRSAGSITLPSFAPGTTAFMFTGGVTGDMVITTVSCTPGSGADLSEPLSLDFTGTVDGAPYEFGIGGYDVTSGAFQLVPAASGAPGVFLMTGASADGTSTFWGAPLRDGVAGAGGTVAIDVSGTQSDGTVNADMTQELRGIATPGGSTVHVVGTWSCPFSD